VIAIPVEVSRKGAKGQRKISRTEEFHAKGQRGKENLAS